MHDTTRTLWHNFLRSLDLPNWPYEHVTFTEFIEPLIREERERGFDQAMLRKVKEINHRNQQAIIEARQEERERIWGEVSENYVPPLDSNEARRGYDQALSDLKQIIGITDEK